MGISMNPRFSTTTCALASRAPRSDVACDHAIGSPPIRQRRSCYPILRNSLTALIIDGSEFQRIYHRTLLSAFGVDVWEVKNGYEALTLVMRGMEFDVIFIDMDLPYLNGAATTRILRRLGVGCKIIGIAVYRNRESDQEAFIISGLDGYHEQLLTYERLGGILRTIDDEC